MTSGVEVGTLGPAGTFSETALYLFIDQLSSKVNVSGVRLLSSISGLFGALRSGDVQKIVVPIENTLNGKVEHTLDALLGLETHYIESEFTIPITHCLFGKSGVERDLVNYVLSHYQPLGQCKEYLTTHFPKAYQIVTQSTAEAAAFLCRGLFLSAIPDDCTPENTVVIGSKRLALEYPVMLLEENINDSAHNHTRFIVIGENSIASTGIDKTALVFTTDNTPGALHQILGLFSEQDINLLSIASRPSKKQLGEYLFYVDVEGHCMDESLQRVLLNVKNIAVFYKLLGSFPVGKELIEDG
mgnify:FL=1